MIMNAPAWHNVLMLATDFDGVHTDGYVYVDQSGMEMVRCSRRDSLGLEMLAKAGVECCVISKEKNPVVARRCEKLGITCYQGVETGDGKREILRRIMAERELRPAQVAYMGDDLNDLAAFELAGIRVTVADGHEQLKKCASYVARARGGEHALREVADLIIDAKNRL